MATPLTSRKKGAILEAARRRFAYYGYAKVTMDEIASDLPLAKASLYYYYPTKEMLLTSVLEQEKEQFVAEIHLILKQRAPASEKLRQYAEKRFELFRELVNLSRASTSRLAEVNTIISDLLSRLETEEVRAVSRILQEGKRSGEFRLQNPQQTAELIPHALHGLRIRGIWRARDGRPDESEYAAIKREGMRLVELLIHGIA